MQKIKYVSTILNHLQNALDEVGGDADKLNAEDKALYNDTINQYIEGGGEFEVVKNQEKDVKSSGANKEL